jgi:hypothetical protein
MKSAAGNRRLVSTAVLAAALVVHLACDSLTPEPVPPSSAPAQFDAIPRAPAGPRSLTTGTNRSILVDYFNGLRFRDWTGTNWGPLQSMPAIPEEARWVVVRNCPTRNETACGTLDKDKDGSLLLYNGSTWGAAVPLGNDLTSDDRIRALDLAYLSSGLLLITYGTHTRGQFGYRLFDGTTLSSEQILAIPATGDASFLALYASPRSNQAVLLVLTRNRGLFLVPWTGTGWGTVTTLTSNAATPNTECFAAAFEGRTGRAVIVYDVEGTPNGASVVVDCNSASSVIPVPMSVGKSALQWCRLAADPFSNTILFAASDSTKRLLANQWNGSAWGAPQEFTSALNFTDRRTFDLAFEAGVPEAVIAYGVDHTDSWFYRTWTQGAWSGENNGRNIAAKPGLVSLVPGQSVGEIFTFVSTEHGVVSHNLWTGSTYIPGIVVNDGMPDDGHTQAFMAAGPAPATATPGPGVIVTIPGGALNLAEGGPAAAISVALDPAPAADVLVVLTPDNQLDIGGGPGVSKQLTFQACGTDVPQVVSVIAVDDEVAQGTHMGLLNYSLTSADLGYNGLVVQPTQATIADNDVAAIILSALSGTQLREGTGDAVSYTCKLGSKPLANVLVTITPQTGLNLGAGSGVPIVLTFIPSNFKTPQTITVRSVDDQVDNGTSVLQLTHTSSSADPAYNAQPIANKSVTVLDNDVAGINLKQPGGGLHVAEGSAVPATYSLVLTSQPLSNGVITAQPDGQLDLGAGPGVGVPLTFTPANWDVPQVVSVLASDDAVAEGAHSGSITHSVTTADPTYASLSVPNVTVQITENDVAGVSVTQTGGTTQVTEGGATDTITVVLNTQPIANVTFTTVNWQTPQPITVAAVDDSVAEGPHSGTITFSVTSSDPAYNGLAVPNVVAQITDNDVAGVSVTQTGGTTQVTEGGATDTFTVVLNTQPIANVTINVTPDGQLDLGGGPGVAVALMFTTANWQTPQPVTVSAVDDAVAEGPHSGTITFSVTSSDPVYSGLAVPNVVVQITDNDVAGVSVTQSGGTTQVTEGGATDGFTVVLNTQPIADVTITLAPDSQLDVGGGGGLPLNLLFTTANWQSPQPVTVTAVDDAVAEGPHLGTITFSVTSSDPVYNGLAVPDVVVQITDNDVAGVSVTQSGGTTQVTEGGATDSFTVVLTSQPIANVTITIAPDSQLDGGGGGGLPLNLLFTSVNWQTPQPVTVAAVDDAVAEGPHNGNIVITTASADANYNGLAVPDVSVQILDNDSTGVLVLESGNDTSVSETGPTSDNISVQLLSQPTADVSVTLSTTARLDLGAGPGLPLILTFTAANWNVPQVVVVTAVDDQFADGSGIIDIDFAVGSADPGYAGMLVPPVYVNIIDNDSPGLTNSTGGQALQVSEEGPTSKTFTIVLDSEPHADVVVQLDTSNQVDLGAWPGVIISRTFAPATWNVPQLVTVTAVDDLIAEGPHTAQINFMLLSADPVYDGLAAEFVAVAIADNDQAGVIFPDGTGWLRVAEGGVSATYELVLTSKPLVKVTVAVQPDAQLDLGNGPAVAVGLAFTEENWNVPQQIDVMAVDDADVEDLHSGTIQCRTVSAAPNYDRLAIPDLVVVIDDNDSDVCPIPPDDTDVSLLFSVFASAPVCGEGCLMMIPLTVLGFLTLRGRRRPCARAGSREIN